MHQLKYTRTDHKTLHFKYHHLCFGMKVPSSGSLLKTKDHMSNTCFRC